MKCPLDGTHTCFVKKLQRHLKVCNARVTVVPPYFVQDINSGDGTIPGKRHDNSPAVPCSPASERVRQPVAADGATHPLLAESLSRPELGADTLKHLRQNAALLAVLRDAGLLQGPRTFVELGSGKAQLSFWLARAVDSQSQIVLVDRASHRHKAENKLKDLADMPDIQRLKIDIRHLNLSGCDACIGRPVVAVSKHLCGAATDLGIRAATAAPMPDTSQPAVSQPESTATSAVQSEFTATSAVQSESTTASRVHPASTEASDVQPGSTEASGAQPESTEAPATQRDCPGPASCSRAVVSDVQGILIALCCHHRVEWTSYCRQTVSAGVRVLCRGFHRSEGRGGLGHLRHPQLGQTPAERRPATSGARTPTSGRDRVPPDQATADQTTAVQTTADQAIADQATANQVTADLVTTDQATADQVTTDRTTADQATAGQTTADQATAGQTAADQATAGQTTADRATGDQTTADQTVASQTATVQASADLASPEQTQKRPGSAEEADAKRARLEAPGPGSRDASAGRYHRLGLTPERRTAVGFMCKRLMDEGRVRYLAARGFSARLVCYVPAAVSPENVLLLAT
ncbi:LOW QUALITY PROTEIN: tRNA:m(4)X modification enzyme TRM13 homolog, partial [Pollicipes pollicipes]|uniref:LOW QUALITY PROTEIN: tRNA:m(4)X modification enzyme TRM13 homolog n=1 Tax=Pollicipes pollicipes TaxID=41117 RepID=UPI001884F111